MATGKRFVFLDRDGTIIVNKHYQKDPAMTELLPNAKKGLDMLRNAGFGLVLVSNQSGIGRGLLRHDDVNAVNQSMVDKLGGGDDYFAGLYYCTHTPDDSCDCRKPLPGLALRASKELGFELADSVVVGDRETDVDLAKAIGAKSVLVRTGSGADVEQKGLCRPDYTADDLLDAAKWILEHWIPS